MATAETDQGKNLQRSKHAKRWTRWLNKNEIPRNSFFITASEKVTLYCKRRQCVGLREVTVGKQRHRKMKRQIQKSPTNTTSAATPLLALEVTQEGRMVNQQQIEGGEKKRMKWERQN